MNAAVKVLLPILLSLLGGSCSLGPNALDNPGFEKIDAKSGLPDGWHPAHLVQTKDFVTFSSVEDTVHSGRRAVLLKIHPDHPKERVAYNWTRPISGLKSGTLYLLSAWVKTEDLKSTAFMMLQYWSGDEQPRILGGARTEGQFPVAGTTEWTHIATVFTVPEGVGHVQLRAGISSPDNIGGKVWFDSVEIREVY